MRDKEMALRCKIIRTACKGEGFQPIIRKFYPPGDTVTVIGAQCKYCGDKVYSSPITVTAGDDLYINYERFPHPVMIHISLSSVTDREDILYEPETKRS